jgi:protein translocase SecG subunit
MKILYYLLCAIQILLAGGLIFLVTIQESKNEGLTGQIGTTVSSAFKGKAGKEERLTQLTRNLGAVFFVISVIVAVTTNRWGP